MNAIGLQFPKANPKTLRSEALNILRSAIINGQLLPGEHLKEVDLSEKMAISRSPIREALRSLEEENLVESVPNQGCFVKTYSMREIQEIFALRAALENLACELLIGEHRLDDNDFDELENYIVRQKHAIQQQDINGLTSLDMDFHEFLCRKSGSTLLWKTWRGLRNQVQVLFYKRFRVNEQISETVDEDHREILSALRRGDLDELAHLNKTINARVANECIAVFQQFGKL